MKTSLHEDNLHYAGLHTALDIFRFAVFFILSFIHSFRIQFCGWIPVTVQCTVCGESPDHERIVQSAQYMCTYSSHEQCPQHT